MKFMIDKSTQRAISKYPYRAKDIVNSFDQRKILVKEKMVYRLKKYQEKGTLPNPLSRINIVGGWYGNILIPLLDEHIKYKQINFYELDFEALSIAKNIYFPKRPEIKWIGGDATKIEFTGNDKLTINTSCEHMTPLNIKKGYVALQSNDYIDIEDHLNCVNNTEELAEQYSMSKVWYESTKDFYNYKRFTVIGRI